MRRSTYRAGVAAVLLTFLVTGCAAEGTSPIPLPGGAPDGDHYTVTVEFTDVLDLVPESAVKVNDVTVGSVERIWLDGWTAKVAVRVDDKVKLPDNAVAGLRQTSLLGEKFVALEPPPDEAPSGRLSDGDLIPLSRTRRSVEVEEVLSAMSLVLNGGGLANLRTINKEIGDVLDGRETEIKDTLHELDDFIGGLEKQKEDIVRAIDALDKLAARLEKERGTVAKALDAMGPGLEVLADQRDELVAMLGSLRKLGDVGTKVIRASRDDTIKVLNDLRPILRQLVKAGDDFPKALDFLMTYPIPEAAKDAMKDGYVNLHITLDLDAMEILKNLTNDPEPERAEGPGPGPGGKLPEVPGLPPGASDSQQGGLAELLIGGMTR